MNKERVLLKELMSYVNLGHLKIVESDGSIEETLFEIQELLAQPKQEQLSEVFRSGMLYSAKKYAATGSERFTGNDIAMFLEMESCELSDGDITAILEPNDDYNVIEKDEIGSTYDDIAIEPITCSMSLEQGSKDESPRYDMSIHTNPNAMAWTKFF